MNFKALTLFQESQEKIQELQAQLKDKTKNSRRLRASFDTLSETNAQLRTQVSKSYFKCLINRIEHSLVESSRLLL